MYAETWSLQSLNLNSNVMVVDWVPQNDVLGHPAVAAFVSHAGSHSMYEAAYHGVPMVAVPFNNDQTHNAIKVIIQSSKVANTTVFCTQDDSHLQCLNVCLMLSLMH